MGTSVPVVPALPDLDSARKKMLAAFQKAAGLRFKSLKLLNLSFTHSSVANETGWKGNNERLEFLGDAILGAVTAALLYTKLADRTEGQMAKIKSVVVSEETLSGLARELGLENLLILGRGEELSGGRGKNAILADTMEALIGALYLDSGYRATFQFVSRCIDPEIERVLQEQHNRDYKSLLQELCQRLYRKHPVYRLVMRSGPDHARLFRMEVQVNDGVFGPGLGKSKKGAEQEAAKIAYEKLREEEMVRSVGN
jgi:ribonuclease-3